MNTFKIWKNTSVLKDYSHNLSFTEAKNEAEIIILGSQKVDLNEFPKVKAIFRAGVGSENIPIDYCNKANIHVEFPSEKTKENLYEETANYAVSLVLRMAYPEQDLTEPWKKVSRNGLQHNKILVIGTGNIGSRVVNKLTSLMEVFSFDIVADEMSTLEALIRSANYISLHIPYTEENKYFFDQEKLAWMKKGSVLINTARAGLVHEEYLFQQIASGRIKAAFDVFWEEPYKGKLKEFHPDSFYMSPHIASSCNDFFLGCRNDLDRMIEKLICEEVLPN